MAMLDNCQKLAQESPKSALESISRLFLGRFLVGLFVCKSWKAPGSRAVLVSGTLPSQTTSPATVEPSVWQPLNECIQRTTSVEGKENRKRVKMRLRQAYNEAFLCSSLFPRLRNGCC
jgi:hypothetical protein